MNEHLSNDQVLEWVMGIRPAACETHVRGCGQCAREIEGVAEPLRLFGETVRGIGSPVEFATALEYERPWRLAWWPVALVAAALLIFAALPLRRTTPPPLRAARPISDEILLQRVESALAASVPGPMEPLASLMKSDGGKL